MRATRAENQAGFAMLALVVVIVPILLLVGSYLQTMTGRNSRLQLEIKEERAMLIAESGVDVALYEARQGTLVAGHNAVFHFNGTLPTGGDYTVTCTYLGDDDRDNDGDGQIDEADEDVFEVVTNGALGTSRRRVAAYLGFSPFLRTPNSAVTMVSPAPTDIRINGSPIIDGRNYGLTGNALVGSGNTYGMSTASPTPTSAITSLLTAGEGSHVTGATAAPSVGQSTTYSASLFNSTVLQARNSAQIIVMSGLLNSNVTYGNAVTGPQYIVYREGNLRINGNFSGAGLLVVNGNLTVMGTMSWTGVVLVTGNIDAANGTAQIRGSLVEGPNGTTLAVKGTADIRYSAAAINEAERLTGRYVALNGWQEISTN